MSMFKQLKSLGFKKINLKRTNYVPDKTARTYI